MKPRQGTATDFVLQTLGEHADRELQTADLAELAAGRFSQANIQNAVQRLLAGGAIAKTVEGRSVWWAIAAPAPAPLVAPGSPVKQAGMPTNRPTMVVLGGRW